VSADTPTNPEPTPEPITKEPIPANNMETYNMETYTARQVADLCNVTSQTIAQWRRYGHIPPKAVSGAGNYNKKEIDALYAAKKLPPAPANFAPTSKAATRTPQALVETKTAATVPTCTAPDTLSPNVATEFTVTASKKFMALAQLLSDLEFAIMPNNLTIHAIEFVYNESSNTFKINNFKLIKK